MKNKIKDLIIAPHADDEVLGCGGILNKDSFVYYCGVDESLLPTDLKHRVSMDKRLSEVKAAGNYLGFRWDWNVNSRVNNYKEIEFIKVFEDLINDLKPDRIFIPFPSYNQDHKVIYNAVRIALRPHDKNHFVKKVLVYEQPHVILWEDKLPQVNYFVPIDIEKKIEAYKCHKSQVRKMRSNELIKSIAKIRGAQSNCKYAEGFIVKRWVE